MSAESQMLCYNMNHKHRGYCAIIRQEWISLLATGGRSVSGSHDLRRLFTSLGFRVKVHIDLTLKGIQNVIEHLAVKTDHTDCDALIIVFLSVGDKDKIYARDTAFHTDPLLESFQGDQCTSLAGKPKIFFIEGNRGDVIQNRVTVPYGRGKKVDHGTLVETDPSSLNLEIEAKQNLRQLEMERSSKYEKHPFEISSHADFLVCWSTPRDKVSMRDPSTGCYFSEALKQVLQRDCEHDDLLSMMTTVNHFLITGFKTYEIRQVSTLIKKVYLTPKHKNKELSSIDMCAYV